MTSKPAPASASAHEQTAGRRPPLGGLSALFLAATLASGCSGDDSFVAPWEGPPPVIDDTSFRFPSAERIVAIGDLHGDLSATRAALRLAGALGPDDHWAGGTLVVVQTGDQLDRGDDEPEILDLLERLSVEAAEAGGALLVLNGNHEVLNVQGDFRWVTPEGFLDYADTEIQGDMTGVPEERRGRRAAFRPGGEAAKRLAKRPAIVQVGDNVFLHGSLHASHVRYGIARINHEIQDWMATPSELPAPSIASSKSGPLWSRRYSDGYPLGTVCYEANAVLEWLGAKRIIVGHTPQEGGVNSACGGRIWRIDVGLSKHWGNPPSVLEIAGDATRIIDESSR